MPFPLSSSRIKRVSLKQPPRINVVVDIQAADNPPPSPHNPNQLGVIIGQSTRGPTPPPKPYKYRKTKTAPVQRSSNIPRLPLELVDLILSHVKDDTQLLLTCGLVSRGWMIISRPYALRRITLVMEWGNQFRTFLDLLLQRSRDDPRNARLPSFVEYTKVVRLDLNHRIPKTKSTPQSPRNDEEEEEGERWARRAANLVPPLAHLTSVRFIQLFYTHTEPEVGGSTHAPSHSQSISRRGHSNSTLILRSVSATFTSLTGLSLLSTVFHSPYILAGFVCSFPCLEDLTCSEVTFRYPSVLDWADLVAISPSLPGEGLVKLTDLHLSLKRLCITVDALGDFSVAWMTKLKGLTVQRLIVDAKPTAHQLWRSFFQVLRVTGRVVEELNFQRCNNLQEIALQLPKIGDLPCLHTLSIIIRQTIPYRASHISHRGVLSFHDREEHLAVLLASLHAPKLRHIVVKLVDLWVMEAPEANETRTRKQAGKVTLASVVPGTLNWGYLNEILSTAKLTPVLFPSHTISTSDIISTTPTPTPRLPLLDRVTFAFQLSDQISVRTMEVVGRLVRERMCLCMGAGVRVNVDTHRGVGWDWEGEQV